MPNSMLSILLMVAMLGCMLASWAVYAAMITGINFKCDRSSQLSYVDRDIPEIFRLHRQFYPESTLPIWMVLSIGCLVVSGFGFVFALSL